MTDREYFYHITQKKWPQKITLYPKIQGQHRSILEPKISRICVSSTIEGCLIALGSCLWQNKSIFVYRTSVKVKAYNAVDVCDSKITKEKWLKTPIKFVKIGTVNKLLPREIFYLPAGTGLEFDLKAQLNWYNILYDMNFSFVDFL